MSRTLPREVSEAIKDYGNACYGFSNARRRASRAALESAILSALDAAREGAMREAADWCAKQSAFGVMFAEGIRRLASRPEPAHYPATPDHIQIVRATEEQVEAFNANPGKQWVIYFEAPSGGTAQTIATLTQYPEIRPAPEPTPDSEGCADPDCRSDWHAIGCPKRPPSPPCTCKMPIGFGRSFRGFMAPDPKCAFCRPAPPEPTHHAWTETSDPMTPMCSQCGVLDGDPAADLPCKGTP